jgi:hypothetical protein
MSGEDAAVSSSSKTVFLHVGCRKSGTTALQLGFRRAAGRVRRHGLQRPLGARGGTMTGLRDPLYRTLEGEDPDAAVRAVARLADRIRADKRPRHLITLEALAELPEEATRVVVEGLAEFDLRVVITTRPWALTIPSEWQQLVKSRVSVPYEDFARAVRDPDTADGELAREALRFRRRQDVADIATRWRAGDPQLPVHVILVPSNRHISPGITDMFCSLVGVDRRLLPTIDRVVNPSISHADAEVLRLVNIALGDRLADARRGYRRSVRKWVARPMMKKSSGGRIRLPHDLEEWASAESRRQLDEILAFGCDVVGDAGSWVEPPLPGDDFVPATDAEVAAAAARVIADLATWHDRQQELQRKRRKRRQQGEQKGQPRAGRVSTARRVLRRLRRG